MNLQQFNLESYILKLTSIKNLISKEKYFDSGYYISELENLIHNDRMEMWKEEEETKEEEYIEDSREYYSVLYKEEKDMRIIAEEKNKKLHEQIDKMEEALGSINENKRCIFELQDLLMELIRFRKVNIGEVENIINILKKTGVDESDINVICKCLINS